MKFHRLIAALALVLFITCIVGVARAQAAGTRSTPCDSATPNNALCISWTAPALNTDGTPTVLPLTYRVQQATAAAGPFTDVATGLATTQFYAKNLAPGTYYFRVYANCTPNCAESTASNVASKSATAPIVTPNAPVIIIAATIRANAPPVYRIVYTVKPKDGEVVFVAPESMRSAFAAR